MANHFQRNEIRAVAALILLLVIGGIMAPVTVQPVAILGLLPFAGILAVAAVGQHLVIQQRGLDISVAGIFSLSAVIVTALQSGAASLPEALGLLVLALLVGGAIGAVNGLSVTRLGIPPLVVTIAMNSVLFGLVIQLSGGTPQTVAAPIGRFSLGRVLGVPNPFLVALILVLIVAFVLARTTLGRRFKVSGLNPVTGRALGFRTELFQVGAYVAAGLLFAAAGVLFAGLSNVPSLMSGNEYMLTTVAAYIVGGNALSGERSSVLATGIGAFFLTYLGQLVVSLGFDTSVQYLIQAVIVLLGVALPSLLQRRKTA
ncbi:ABC transporter permease [Pseudooceanicola sp. GBMRC 2024]|uniref:Autoinducer 2 import system permease protein LsrC n=1 Tax=Pseudooceanicola albus TaxID=2692189 RepID=A0A6L7G1R5_9RHOB|nr:ABC transporter permease [Pseudooceanicola albus]MXN17849.1 ABC transporter permease [Pseudooceanicola albus]